MTKLSKAQEKALKEVSRFPGSIIHGGTRKSLVAHGLIEANPQRWERVFSRTSGITFYCKITDAGRAWLKAN